MSISRSVSVGCLALLSLALAACTVNTGGGGAGPGGGGGAGAGGATPATSAKFFLPTGEPDNTSAPTVEIDPKGGIHAVYPAYAGGDAYYAYCPADCAGEGQVKVVHLVTEGSVANAMLALDAAGSPHVLLAAAQAVYYAHPSGDPTAQASWRTAKVLEHGGAREVTGEAFALDPAGRPRFLMHTTVAYLGVGQKAPETHWVACDAGCDDASGWTSTRISTEMWQSASLRFDKDGRAKVAAVVRTGMSDSSSGKDTGAYLECAGDCAEEASWKGIGFGLAYSSSLEAVTMKPAISLALTKAGRPRVLFMGREEETSNKRFILYLECDADCASDASENWKAMKVTDDDRIGAGIDLALDGADHPRFVYTASYNIGLAYCDSASCAGPEAKWDVTKVEAGSDMPPDQIILWPNCTVGAWFLHSPSIALTADGRPRVGYQARDISGGVKNPDRTKPACVAGTDMTWSRLAVMPGVK